jgi:hypothetical protein
MARKQDRFTRDAQLETGLRFGDQETALASLLASERQSRINTIRSAEGAARSATASAQASRPVLRKIYEEAGLTRQEANQDADTAMSGLGQAADVFRGAIARERAQAKTRIGESQASALGGVEERVGQIALGAQAARNQADTRWADAQSQIGQQFAGLQGQKGAFAALTVSQAKEAQRNRDVQLRSQDLAHQLDPLKARQIEAGVTGIDPVTGKPTPASRRAAQNKKGKGTLTRDQRQKRLDQVGYAQGVIRQLRTIDRTIGRSDVAGSLLTGRQIKDANGKTVLTIKPVGQQWASVALDLEFDGHVSRANRERLRRAGISAKRAGWNTTPRPKPRPRSSLSQQFQDASRGGVRPTGG